MMNLYWYILGLLLVVSCSEISQKNNVSKDFWAYPGVYEVDSMVIFKPTLTQFITILRLWFGLTTQKLESQ
jgi:hypothetical protein